MKNLVRTVFSTSGAATVLMVMYMGSSILSLYRLMYPLSTVDLSIFERDSFVRPLWKQGEKMYLRVYLATHPSLSEDFFLAEYEQQDNEVGHIMLNEVQGTVALLWDETVDSPTLSRSFLLTTCRKDAQCQEAPSYTYASSLLDHAEKASELPQEGFFSVVASAGHGIESTSILLTFYQSLYVKLRSLLSSLHLIKLADKSAVSDANQPKRKILNISPSSSLWSTLQSNSTLYLHVLVLRANALASSDWPPSNASEILAAARKASRLNALLAGKVDLVKFDAPHHIRKPSRLLSHDVAYLYKKIFFGSTERPPWDIMYSNPEEYQKYHLLKRLKESGSGYPYWKPEVSIKYVADVIDYPLDYVGASGMPIVRVQPNWQNPTGYSYTPAIHVDEIGLTSEKYIPVNETLTSLPLRITFDRSDMEHESAATTGTAGGISPARWRLLSHLSKALESQKALGLDESDIDDVRRLIADTNVTLLMITLLASALHLLFEFLTFKNEVSFWKANIDLTGISVRSLFLDVIGQSVVLLYLIEQDSSLLITIPSSFGCLIALWKCHRAAGLCLVRLTEERRQLPCSWWNVVPRLCGYELRATRLEVEHDHSEHSAGCEKSRLAALTLESDRIATRTLGIFLLPMVLMYTLYQWMYVPHISWYSWIITSASSAVYALGFVLMTPQLFLNYKLKSVAHLPWRVLVYKSLNTFIDDLFSFIIRMPTMARISCFRDDIVFFVYLYQRWLYPVDKSRPVEGEVGERTEKSLQDKKEE